MFDGIKSKIKSLIYRGYRIDSYCVAAATMNHNTFYKYKNCNKNEDVVLCGAGPSFKKYIPIKNAKHVALNRALLNKKINFDFFVADDWEGIKFMKDELINYKCVKFFGHQIGEPNREIPETFLRECNAERYYTDSFMVENGYKSIPACDIDCLPVGNMPNIALSAMQIILFTNPRTIYLVGCDATSDGHFVEEKMSEKEKKKQKKDMDMAITGSKVIDCWKKLKEFASCYYPDVRIVSINPVGLKGLFVDSFQNEKGELEFSE